MSRSRIVGILLFLGVFAWAGCASKDWPVYRYKAARTADQPNASSLSDPSRVPGLHRIWEFRPSSVGDPDTVPGGFTGADGFVASPTVYRGKVFVGHRNGRFYALDANTGTLIWRYPVPPQALLQNYPGNASSPGIASSGTIAKVWVPWFWFFKRPVKVVIFGAPDPSVCVGTACGSGRLWALNVDTGALVWKSDVVANLTGLTWGSLTELHERIGYSSPVVANGKVYVGIADNGDSPIQLGRLAAVGLQTGTRVGTFSFVSSGLPPGAPPNTLPRGGGIWSSPAASGDTVFVTTGNGCRPGNGGCTAEPANNHALSMLKLNGSTGGVLWKLQPVPWALDVDPDWAATPLVARTSCGRLTVAPMKDGYTHAVNADTGAVVWSFPFEIGRASCRERV